LYSPKFKDTLEDIREDIGDEEFLKTLRQFFYEQKNTFKCFQSDICSLIVELDKVITVIKDEDE